MTTTTRTTKINKMMVDGVPAAPAVAHPLATPTDLPLTAVQAMTTALNQLLADAFALYVKTKNYHWHVTSAHFRDYHLLFEEQAGQILNGIDPLAERVRKLGGTTIHSISQIGQLQSIADDNASFVPVGQMIQNLIRDNRHIASRQRTAMELADEMRDYPTSNLLQGQLDETEKRIWFLYAASINQINADVQ